MISIIIPVYNAEQFIAETIDAILCQSYSDFEIIAIDDGSSDSSYEILRKLCTKDERVKVFHQSNAGVSAARNAGLSLAQGEYICFVDSDDIVETDYLEKMYCAIENSDLVICGFKRRNLITNNIVSKLPPVINLSEGCSAKKFISDLKFEDKGIVLNYLWNKLFDKKIICDANLKFDERLSLGEDFVFNCEYIKRCKIISTVQASLYIYIKRPIGSLTTKFDYNEYDRRLIMRDCFRNFLQFFEIEPDSSDLFMMNEGAYLITSLEKIGRVSQKNSFTQKKIYINSFLNDENIQYMRFYLKRRKGIKCKVLDFLVMIKNIYLLYIFFKIKEGIKAGI